MDNLKLFISLSRTMLYLDRVTDKIYKEHGITKTQFAVLEVLYHNGDLSQCDIRQLILTTAGNLPVVINNLLKEDLISKRPHEEDGRRQVLSLTVKGRKLIEEVFPKNQKCIEDCFSVWTEKEKEMLHAAMKKLRKEHYES